MLFMIWYTGIMMLYISNIGVTYEVISSFFNDVANDKKTCFSWYTGIMTSYS